MASKVPKFGAWEGGEENYTVYFDKARDSKHTGKKINPNDPEENPDMFRQIKDSAQTQPQTKTRADKHRTPAKVPHFGAWEDGDSSGYTETFKTVRRDKLGGPNAAAAENEPQMNRDMPLQSGPSVHAQAQPRSQPQAAKPQTRTRADKQRTQATVPHFGAWDNGDPSGYTQTFEKVRRYRLGEPTAAENGPQINRDMPPQSGPSVHAQPQSQPEAQPRPASREGRSKVPKFGEWESESAGGYTHVFNDLHHKKHPYSTGPQPNRDVGPKPREGNTKTPEFGDWEGGEAVQYTEYFENPQRIKNSRPAGLNQTEPQMNRDVSQDPHVTRREGHGKPSSQVTPVHPNANFQPRLPAIRGNPPTTIPNFGGWNTDPTQAEGYTGEFTRAREERQTPQHHTVPPPYKQQHRYNKQKQQPSCCTIL